MPFHPPPRHHRDSAADDDAASDRTAQRVAGQHGRCPLRRAELHAEDIAVAVERGQLAEQLCDDSVVLPQPLDAVHGSVLAQQRHPAPGRRPAARQGLHARQLPRHGGLPDGNGGKFLLSWPDATAPPNFDKHTIIKGGYTNYNARVEGVSRQVAEYSTTFLGSSLRGYVRGFESNDTAPWFAYFAPQAPHIVGGWKSLAVPEAKYASATVGNCVQVGEPNRATSPRT